MKISPQDLEKDFYSVLGIGKSASAKDVKKAYRKLAQEYHPDKHPGDTASEEKFKEVSHAYDVLGDDEKRKDYDEGRELLASGGLRFGPGPGGAGGAGFGGFGGGIRVEDLGGLGGFPGFESLFDFPTGASAHGGPRRGQDLSTSLNLGFADALEGVTATLTITADSSCSTCRGTGATPGTLPKTCDRCHGTGRETETQGRFGFSRVCSACGGAGQIIENPCSACGGSGIRRRPRNIKAKIPAGVGDGQTIRLKGKGGPGLNGGPAGDLFVKVNVGSHPVFGRKGSNLTITVPVTYPELALGADIRVPTMSTQRKIRIPAGTRSGRTFKVKGEGAPKKGGGRGDLLVTVDVAIPKKLKAKEKALLEQFAEIHDESPRAYLDERMEA